MMYICALIKICITVGHFCTLLKAYSLECAWRLSILPCICYHIVFIILCYFYEIIQSIPIGFFGLRVETLAKS